MTESGPSEDGWARRATGVLREHRRRVRSRTLAARVAASVGLISLVSALVPRFWLRLEMVDALLPVVVVGRPHLLPRAAATALVFVSTGLLALARGLRLGQRLAWAATVGLLLVAAVLHLAKGLDLEMALAAVVGAAWLAGRSAAFPVLPSRTAVRRVAWLAGPAVLVGGGGSLALAWALHHERRLVPTAIRFDHLLSPMAVAAGVCVLVVVLWVLLSPHVGEPVTAAEQHRERERARGLVEQHGRGTLDYFALRDDKSWFVVGSTVVAHSVRAGVCLVSPDPIGPPEERVDAWADFLAHVERHGWSVAVVGASVEWLPVYEACGLRALYLGDEAVVDARAFDLEGGARKSLRQAVNRVARGGWTTTIGDPRDLDRASRDQVLAMGDESRRGATERGFSMTLSRLFDPDDTGLLLSVTRSPEGRVDAFCQWAPAPGIDGWSLDVMRRRLDEPDLPNGLLDSNVVAMIGEVAARGQSNVGLNFAVLRRVMEGEGETRLDPVLRPVLERLAQGTQLATLATFNEKYGPSWVRRYLVLDAAEFVATQALAVAGAEGVTELPVIGRFLGPASGGRERG